MIGGINLFSPASYADGHPTDQYAWLRDNDPVHWHSRARWTRLLGSDPV